jgi:hypothetical protein
MFSFLREAPLEGKPGPLSMRRIAAAVYVLAAVFTAILSIRTIFRFIGLNPNTEIDWRAFIPLFIPCGAFLLGSITLLLFTTLADIKEIISGAAALKGKEA